MTGTGLGGLAGGRYREAQPSIPAAPAKASLHGFRAVPPEDVPSSVLPVMPLRPVAPRDPAVPADPHHADWRPRMVVSDLDGTLLDEDGVVSDRAIAALRQARAAGALVVPATGRHPGWVSMLLDAGWNDGLMVCANGGVLYDITAHAVLDVAWMDPEPIAARIKARYPDVLLAVMRPDGILRHEPHDEAPIDRLNVPQPLAELLAQPASKMFAFLPSIGIDPVGVQRITDEVAVLLADLAEVTQSGMVEISPLGVTKAWRLAQVAAAHGIGANEVVAFGDMPNDLAMLRWAGRGYAMANAHPSVLDAAGWDAPANGQDGVASVLERWFPPQG